MPYKEAIKLKAESNSTALIQKSEYKVANWSVYNKSLKNRGKLSLYFPKGDLRSQFINDNSYSKGMPGRTALYSGAYIEVIFIHYRLFGWGMRQITGYFEDLWESKNIDIGVPFFGSLSDLFASISLETIFPVIPCDKYNKGISKLYLIYVSKIAPSIILLISYKFFLFR